MALNWAGRNGFRAEKSWQMVDVAGPISTVTEAVGASLFLCSLLELVELVDLAWNWRRTTNRTMMRLSPAADAREAFVSLHVPLCSEPVPVVKETLRALAALEYPHYEVVVVYNNTRDRELWEPVAKLCADLGPRFKFHYIRELQGFKAGALNFALRQTAPHTEIIAVVDADYVLEPGYLKRVLPFFSDERLAFLQTPQDYRCAGRSWFPSACYWEYWQFFEVGMTIRSLRNAPMLHGTMSVIRKNALVEAGGWAEWCVTEDSELGLRLLSLGHKGRYLKTTYGRGLLPFSFRDYKRQRWRWVAGGAQQLVRYWPQLTTGRQLSVAQKVHHLQGWLPWLRDALLLASLIVVGLAAIQVILVDHSSLVPLLTLGAGLTSVILQQVVRQLIIYKARLGLRWSDTIGATIAVLSLTLTIGPAWVLALFGRRTPFEVTPKAPELPGAWWRDLKLELACGTYVAVLSLALLTAEQGALWIAPLVPALYLPLIVPAYVMCFASRRAMQTAQIASATSDTPEAAILDRP